MAIEFTPRMARELIGADRATIVEAGANDGFDTQRFLDAFTDPKTCVYAFEPDPRAIREWEGRITDPRAELFPCALADANGFRSFHQSAGKPPGKQWEGVDDWNKSGSLLAPDQHQRFDKWLRFCDGLKVPCYTLDTLMADVSEVSLLWSDLQGAEAMMLRGASAILKRTRFVYAEIHLRPLYKDQATFGEVAELLTDFEMIGAYAGDNFLWQRRDV